MSRLVIAVAVVALVILGHLRRDSPAGPLGVLPPRPYAAAPADAAAATYTFDPGVSELNRRAFLESAARVRPEVARLFDRVDGIVTVVDAPTGDPRALAITQPRRDGYTITVPFGAVFHELGRRGFDRVVQHELGHVVDFALVPDALQLQLDAGVPPGQPCVAGTRTGSCAPREERFAETFAKWASGDIGVNLYAGYAVPPPPSLEVWGRPLAELAGG